MHYNMYSNKNIRLVFLSERYIHLVGFEPTTLPSIHYWEEKIPFEPKLTGYTDIQTIICT